MASFIVEKNLSLSTADGLTELFPVMFPDEIRMHQKTDDQLLVGDSVREKVSKRLGIESHK